MQIILEFSRFSEHKDTLAAELSVSHELNGALHWSRINLASANGRTAVVKALGEDVPGVPWRTVLDRSCQEVARQMRVVEPVEDITPSPPTLGRWLVEPWIPQHETTILFGDGGTGKSLFALALACAGLQGHVLGPWHVRDLSSVLYLDWESTAESHRARVWGLTNHREPLGHGLHYRRMTRPLTDVIEVVRGDVDRYKPGLVVCDSLGAAAGPEPESGDAAIRTMMALASLHSTRLVLAHIAAARLEQRKARPYGSVYNHNLARSTIEARGPEDEEEGRLVLSFFHRKANFGPLARPAGVQFVFSPEGVIDVQRTQPDFAHGSHSAQILAALADGPKNATELAEDLDLKAGVVRMVLGRLEKRNNVVRLVAGSQGRGKKSQWGLADTKRNSDPF